MKKLRIAQAMMLATILLIVAFQAYYIHKLYKSEWSDLRKETDILFRETVYKLQVARFKQDTTFVRKLAHDNVFNVQAINVIKNKKQRVKEQKVKQDSIVAPKTFVITMSPDSNHTLTPQQLRLKLDSLTLRRPGSFKMIASPGNGDRIKVFTRSITVRDSLRFFDSTISRVEGLRHRVEVPPASVVSKPRSRMMVAAHEDRLVRTNDNVLERDLRIMPVPSDDPEIQIFTNSKSLNDSLPLRQLDSAYNKELKRSSINLPFSLLKSSGKKTDLDPKEGEFKTNPASVGFLSPYHYQAQFQNPFYFLVRKIAPNIIFSLLLVAFTVGSFIVLYRNLMAQRRLADIKNEFISNITHELKTPIATVTVAIEAMRNFGALQSPGRTKEYMDISASELQRLSLLVDKVLKLSMFEKKEIEVKKDIFNMQELVKEVMASLRLQFEKTKAAVSFVASGADFNITADRLHITSVIYNLLDNAIKYSDKKPVIDVTLKEENGDLYFSVADKGMGINQNYQEKIFEKFFRVPTNNTHNIKGYGLGLSYVSHIVQQHNGSIKVESEAGSGSNFTIQLPKG